MKKILPCRRCGKYPVLIKHGHWKSVACLCELGIDPKEYRKTSDAYHAWNLRSEQTKGNK